MRVLLAEKDKRLGKLTKYLLEQNEMAVEWVTTGETLTEYAMYDEYDILLFDWSLLGEDAAERCHQLREKGFSKGLIILTEEDSVDNRVAGLEAGADDFLLKPFDIRELTAKIHALGRRFSQRIQSDIVKVGDLILNRTARVVRKKRKVIQLSAREFQIFDLLVQNKGIVVPREIIQDRIWGLESEVTTNNIDSYIKLLRRKLNSGTEKSVIQTVRGIGYKLEI